MQGCTRYCCIQSQHYKGDLWKTIFRQWKSSICIICIQCQLQFHSSMLATIVWVFSSQVHWPRVYARNWVIKANWRCTHSQSQMVHVSLILGYRTLNFSCSIFVILQQNKMFRSVMAGHPAARLVSPASVISTQCERFRQVMAGHPTARLPSPASVIRRHLRRFRWVMAGNIARCSMAWFVSCKQPSRFRWMMLQHPSARCWMALSVIR